MSEIRFCSSDSPKCRSSVSYVWMKFLLRSGSRSEGDDCGALMMLWARRRTGQVIRNGSGWNQNLLSESSNTLVFPGPNPTLPWSLPTPPFPGPSRHHPSLVRPDTTLPWCLPTPPFAGPNPTLPDTTLVLVKDQTDSSSAELVQNTSFSCYT